jgi:hypothetical protein
MSLRLRFQGRPNIFNSLNSTWISLLSFNSLAIYIVIEKKAIMIACLCLKYWKSSQSYTKVMYNFNNLYYRYTMHIYACVFESYARGLNSTIYSIIYMTVTICHLYPNMAPSWRSLRVTANSQQPDIYWRF